MKKKKRAMKKSQDKNSISRKDFETFKFGVERLNELKKELDSLDTRGFSSEEKAIRSKLKIVSEIPNIERALRNLKLKINKKFKPSKKSKNLIKEDIKDIKENLPRLKSEIRLLGKKVDEAERKDNSKKDIKAIKENLPELKSEIRRLGKKVDESKTKGKIKIDSGIDVLVDADFNDFLSKLKISLSDRIATREKEIDGILESDLRKRGEEFQKKQQNLINHVENLKKGLEEKEKDLKRNLEKKEKEKEKNLNKEYERKVDSTLKKEVAEKFHEQLRNALDKEKVELGKKYRASLRAHAEEELAKQRAELKNKLQKDRENFNLSKETERKNIREKISQEFHQKLNEELAKGEKRIREETRNEFELKMKKRMQEHEEELKKKKLDLELEMQRKIKQVLQ